MILSNLTGQITCAPTFDGQGSVPVFFYGVLVVERLDWLSDRGDYFLETDLNVRDGSGRKSVKSKKAPTPRGLTLEGLYGDRVIGKALPLKSGSVFEKIHGGNIHELHSLPRQSCFELAGIERLFRDLEVLGLDNHTLVKLINETVDDPRYNLRNTTCDVEVLVKAYLRKHEEEKWCYSVIFAKEGEVPVNPRLRHISRAEVREVICCAFRLAPGLLSASEPEVSLGRSRLVQRFIGRCGSPKECEPVVAGGALTTTRTTGTPSTSGDYISIARTLAKFGKSAAEWELILNRAITRRSLSPLSVAETEDPEPVPGGLIYDSDFSEPSTPGCSDSEYDSDTLPPRPSTAQLPLHKIRRPELLPGRFVWNCTLCTYSFDLLNIEPDHEWDLPEGDKWKEHYVRQRQYSNLQDDFMQQLLQKTADRHYREHLDRDSAGLSQTDKNYLRSLLDKCG
ncbi:hypothetical protein C8J57DRAFT_1664166 [Mycena rebaudengoi]|nr:hypothetical protein C8J57DRAFT_1664166 [Mycena rebaudengoi]